MKIENIRLGFATNSSSLHSIVIIPRSMIGVEQNELENDGEYGWDTFTLATEPAKKIYFATLLMHNISKQIGNELARHTVTNLLGGNFHLPSNSYVDHQSLQNFPRGRDKYIHMEFLKDYINFIKRDDVLILGGNDNGGDHPLAASEGIEHLNLPSMMIESDELILAQKDKQSNHWILFNTKNGTKVSFSFDETVGPRTFSSFPELVDISITDYCEANCPYCYRASTTKGQHATLEYISQIASSLEQLGTFEVAIGGGDPLHHPAFTDILNIFVEYGIIPNFTTRRTDWMFDSRKDEYLKLCGSFAFSVDSFYYFKEFLTAAMRAEIPLEKVNIQIVDKTVEKGDLFKILNLCYLHDIRATILGYKTTGFGAKYLDNEGVGPEESNWVDAVIKAGNTTIGIDTTLANEYSGILDKLKVSKYTYRTQEGMFSMFIDAVKRKVGPSSYCFNSQYVNMHDITAEGIESVFNVFHTFKQIDKPAATVLNT